MEKWDTKNRVVDEDIRNSRPKVSVFHFQCAKRALTDT